MNKRLEELTSRFEYWHEKLINSKGYPALSSLEEIWQLIDNESDIPFTREEIKDISGNPLGSISYIIEMGYYPPPELLLCLSECFNVYLSGGGSLELEEIFFGKPKKGLGNHAARFKKDLSMLDFKLRLEAKNNPDKTQIQIAVDYISENNLEIDPESLLRTYRRSYKNYKADKY